MQWVNFVVPFVDRSLTEISWKQFTAHTSQIMKSMVYFLKKVWIWEFLAYPYEAWSFHVFCLTIGFCFGSLFLGAVILINHVTGQIRSANQISNEHINRKFNPGLKIEDAGCHPSHPGWARQMPISIPVQSAPWRPPQSGKPHH